ncbi:MAG: DUF917 domain-containing protein [Bacillota bacterium]|nr:DUF917 domain-containing protein [Bacillota bacterium]
MSRLIYPEDLDDLAVGAAILGTGGGGDPFIGKLMAQIAMGATGPVRLITADELQDDDFVIPSAMMGAPTVMLEKIPQGEEAVAALRALENHLGRKATATSPIECGGINSMIPFIVAARTGLPVVDGDGMGRAFPELQMETFHVYGVQGWPAVVADEHGQHVIIESQDNYRLEWLARGVTIRMGGHATLLDYPMTGKQYKETAVRGTVSMGLAIGRAVREAHRQRIHPVDAVCRATNIFTGLGEDQGSRLRIEFQNENLVAIKESERGQDVLATVPDLICVLDSETGTAITTERLRYGQRARIIGIPTPDIMRTPEALKVWGPKAFGYEDVEFIPLERKFQDYYRQVGVPEGKRIT